MRKKTIISSLRSFAALAAVLAFVHAGPVRSDLAAQFQYPEQGRRGGYKVEVSDSGAMRFQSNDESYVLILNGQYFQVRAGPGGPIAITGEALAHMARQQVRRGEILFSPSDKSGQKPADPIRYIPSGEVTIAGHAGVRYAVPGTKRASLILSTDPELLVLGMALGAYFASIEAQSAQPDKVTDNIQDLLATHGVLGFWGQGLASIDRSPIDLARFVLPVEPVTLADVVSSEEGVVSKESSAGRRADIIGAVYRNGSLLTLTDDGNLQTWSEGSVSGSPVETPGLIRSFCANASEIVLATWRREDRQTVLWSGRPGQWRKLSALEYGEDDPFLALNCDGPEPLVLAKLSLQWPRSGRKLAIDPQALHRIGYTTTLQHGGYLYVGSNAGEWGGGLRRYPLSGGTGEPIDDSDPDVLCGGKLNSNCAPVTGLAPDPARPDCLLAASGLAHFMASGSVLRICGSRIEVAYAKPYTLQTNWRFDPASPPNARSAVPFYSLRAGKGGTWAVASDGIYRFGSSGLPDFTAFPGGKRFPVNGVDWSHPEFVLVSTSMNQRHSLSGASLILVSRN